MPDTLDAAGYFPLTVGNEWHFDRETFNSLGVTERAWTEAWRVVADSAVSGRSYSVIRSCEQESGSDEVSCEAPPMLVRFDEAVGAFASLHDGADVPWNQLPCPIRSTAGSEAFCLEGLGVVSEYQTSLYASYSGPLLPLANVVVKEYESLVSSHALVYGLGVFREQFGDPWIVYESHLQYAVVEGQEVGEPAFSIPNATSPAAPLTDLMAAVGPNPTHGPLSLTVSAPAPLPVRAAVFDLLGRHVVEVAGEAGPQPLALDLSGSAPGLYVIRVEVGDDVLTRRVTVAR